jgi:hypothetical protein
MAKISRVKQLIFALNDTLSNCGVFGSRAANNPQYSKDLATIQSLPSWLNGLKSALNAANKAPFSEDTNSVYYVLTSQLAYLFQDGIPVYEANTTYYTTSIVRKDGTYELYGSLVDDNTGHPLGAKVDTSYWKFLVDLAAIVQTTIVNNNNEYITNFTPPVNKLYVGLAEPNSFYPTGLVTTAVPLSEVWFDQNSEWDNTTHLATLKDSGYYIVNYGVCAKSAAGALSRIIGGVMVNYTLELAHSYGYRETTHPEGDGSNRVTATGSAVLQLTVGDKIGLFINPPETYDEIHGKSKNGYYTFLSYARIL